MRAPAAALPAGDSSMPASSRALVALALVFSLLWFADLGTRALHHPDEGRYAEIAREMHASGDLVTPRLNGLRYFEKPPLQYWLTAASFAAFGVRDWAARLPVALFGWLAIVAVGYAACRVAGPVTGWRTAAVLASMVWPIGLGHFVSLDAVLTGCLALAFAAFLVAQAGTTAHARAWMLVAWAATAGAVLTKGLVGLAIPSGALLLYTLVTRDFAVWRRLALLPGLALLVASCAPWFMLVASRNPEFTHFFFVREHVERFLTTEHQREGAWWYFVPLLVLGLLPWTGAFAFVARASWRDAPRTPAGFAWPRFAWAWIAFVFIFFSASGSKLPSYILPLFPAAALLVAWQVERLPPRPWYGLLAAFALGAALLALALWLGYGTLAHALATERTPVEAWARFGHGLRSGMAIIALFALIAWLAWRRRTLAVVLLALGMNGGLALALWGNPGLDEARSTTALVTRLASRGYEPSAPFYQVRMYDQTLPWYLRRTIVVVDYRDELALGEDAEPGKWIPDIDQWTRQWQALPQGFAAMTPDTWDALARAGVAGHIVTRNSRYVIVARR
jgi:4-amino-4-deoxy-L-arabinose transferase-like glycosyltransferase